MQPHAIDERRRRVLGGLGLSGLLALPAHAAPTQGGGARVALVIGNAAYAGSPLRNPGRDARAMAELLGGLGFQVIEERDAERARMEAAIERAATLLRGRDGIGLLYYAGHALQIDWHNYMLPVDIRIETAADVPRQGLDVQRVLQAFQTAATRTNILVLDACRDNPFAAARGGVRGLAPMDAPPGTFYAYATAPGNVADDGSEADGNGLYTRYLLQELKKPDARIEDVFKRVRLQVRQATQGRQIPWESTSLEEDFVFATGQRLAAPGMSEREREFDEERAEWDRLRASQRPEDFFAFLQRHPSGSYTELAQFSLDRLSRPQLVAQAPAALQAVATLPAGVDRYRVGDEWDVVRTDHMNGDATSSRRARVTGVQGTRVLANGGRLVLDQMGSVIMNETGTKDPGILFTPADLRLGKRWRSAFRNTQLDGFVTKNFYDHRVEALEDVTVPAGRFKAYRVASTGQAIRPNGGTDLQVTHWIDPATMWTVRTVAKRTTMHKGWLEFHATDEVVEFRRAPR
jgi:uncharacterized caspase-like protein